MVKYQVFSLLPFCGFLGFVFVDDASLAVYCECAVCGRPLIFLVQTGFLLELDVKF